MGSGTFDEELTIGVTLDDKGVTIGVSSIRRHLKNLDDDIDKVHKKSKSWSDSMMKNMNSINSGFQAGIGVAKGFFTALVAVDTAILGAAAYAAKKASDFEALELSLTAVEGSAIRAKDAMKELREIARLPGIGIEEAIKTFSGLRRGGVNKELSMSLTRELGNAVARSGGGREELGRAGLAIGQIANKPNLHGQELMQLAEAGIPAYKMIADIFGTAEGEELKKKGIGSAEVLRALNDELKKLERVSGGAKNTFENFGMAVEQTVVSLGNGINTVFVPFMDDLEKMISKVDGDVLGAMGENIGTAILGVIESVTGGSDAISILESIEQAVLITAFATQNMVENTRGFADKWDRFWHQRAGEDDQDYDVRKATGIDFNAAKTDLDRTWENLTEDGARNKAAREKAYKMYGDDTNEDETTQITGDESPSQRARKVAYQKQQERKRKKEGERKRGHVMGPNGEWTLEDRGERSGTALPADPTEAQSTSTSPALPILKSIDTTLKETRDSIREALLGGGTATKNAFTARNIAGWSGSGGSRGMQMIMQGIQIALTESSIGNARLGTYNPQSH